MPLRFPSQHFPLRQTTIQLLARVRALLADSARCSQVGGEQGHSQVSPGVQRAAAVLPPPAGAGEGRHPRPSAAHGDDEGECERVLSVNDGGGGGRPTLLLLSAADTGKIPVQYRWAEMAGDLCFALVLRAAFKGF